MRTIAASEFKAKCLAILDEVARTGERILIVKRGKPVAQVGPASPAAGRFPQDALKGKGEIVGDIVAPVLPADAWDVERASKP